jgi:hypothetical protein
VHSAVCSQPPCSSSSAPIGNDSVEKIGKRCEHGGQRGGAGARHEAARDRGPRDEHVQRREVAEDDHHRAQAFAHEAPESFAPVGQRRGRRREQVAHEARAVAEHRRPADERQAQHEPAAPDLRAPLRVE